MVYFDSGLVCVVCCRSKTGVEVEQGSYCQLLLAMALPCCMSADEYEQHQKSKKIDSQIAKEKVYFRRKVKILLLGAGESGKSTFLKQMRIIHGKDYDEQALCEFRPIIYSNIVKAMKVLADARRVLKIEWGDPECQVYGDMMLSFQTTQTFDTATFAEYVGAVKSLWKDSGIQEAYRRRNEFQLVSIPNIMFCWHSPFFRSIDLIKSWPFDPLYY